MDVKVSDMEDTQAGFIDDVIEGLSKKDKTLPCKYFYDEQGSLLFEEICQLDEYYITRTELDLLNQIKANLARMIGADAIIIEPGAGAGIKVQTLLGALDKPQTYVPIDISKDFLFDSAQKIEAAFPQVEILPIQGDFTAPIVWHGQPAQSNRIVFFPGSTIGNFTPDQALDFLQNQALLCGPQGAVIIGVDLVKSSDRLESAYNDARGITSAFNKNLLKRINQELKADFDLDKFSHQAVFNENESRIEMHLVSKEEQTVKINQQKFQFKPEESIHTENSYKYSISRFTQLAHAAGLNIEQSWTDSEKLFSIHFLRPT